MQGSVERQERRDQRRLGRSDRYRAWQIAGHLDRDFGGNIELCRQNAKKYAQKYGVSLLVIIAVVRLILAIIEWKYSSGIAQLPAEPVDGAPGFTPEDYAGDDE